MLHIQIITRLGLEKKSYRVKALSSITVKELRDETLAHCWKDSVSGHFSLTEDDRNFFHLVFCFIDVITGECQLKMPESGLVEDIIRENSKRVCSSLVYLVDLRQDFFSINSTINRRKISLPSTSSSSSSFFSSSSSSSPSSCTFVDPNLFNLTERFKFCFQEKYIYSQSKLVSEFFNQRAHRGYEWVPRHPNPAPWGISAPNLSRYQYATELPDAFFWELSNNAKKQGRLLRKVKLGHKREVWREGWYIFDGVRLWVTESFLPMGSSSTAKATNTAVNPSVPTGGVVRGVVNGVVGVSTSLLGSNNLVVGTSVRVAGQTTSPHIPLFGAPGVTKSSSREVLMPFYFSLSEGGHTTSVTQLDSTTFCLTIANVENAEALIDVGQLFRKEIFKASSADEARYWIHTLSHYLSCDITYKSSRWNLPLPHRPTAETPQAVSEQSDNDILVGIENTISDLQQVRSFQQASASLAVYTTLLGCLSEISLRKHFFNFLRYNQKGDPILLLFFWQYCEDFYRSHKDSDYTNYFYSDHVDNSTPLSPASSSSFPSVNTSELDESQQHSSYVSQWASAIYTKFLQLENFLHEFLGDVKDVATPKVFSLQDVIQLCFSGTGRVYEGTHYSNYEEEAEGYSDENKPTIVDTSSFCAYYSEREVFLTLREEVAYILSSGQEVPNTLFLKLQVFVWKKLEKDYLGAFYGEYYYKHIVHLLALDQETGSKNLQVESPYFNIVKGESVLGPADDLFLNPDLSIELRKSFSVPASTPSSLLSNVISSPIKVFSWMSRKSRPTQSNVQIEAFLKNSAATISKTPMVTQQQREHTKIWRDALIRKRPLSSTDITKNLGLFCFPSWWWNYILSPDESSTPVRSDHKSFHFTNFHPVCITHATESIETKNLAVVKSNLSLMKGLENTPSDYHLEVSLPPWFPINITSFLRENSKQFSPQSASHHPQPASQPTVPSPNIRGDRKTPQPYTGLDGYSASSRLKRIEESSHLKSTETLRQLINLQAPQIGEALLFSTVKIQFIPPTQSTIKLPTPVPTITEPKSFKVKSITPLPRLRLIERESIMSKFLLSKIDHLNYDILSLACLVACVDDNDLYKQDQAQTEGSAVSLMGSIFHGLTSPSEAPLPSRETQVRRGSLEDWTNYLFNRNSDTTSLGTDLQTPVIPPWSQDIKDEFVGSSPKRQIMVLSMIFDEPRLTFYDLTPTVIASINAPSSQSIINSAASTLTSTFASTLTSTLTPFNGSTSPVRPDSNSLGSTPNSIPTTLNPEISSNQDIAYVPTTQHIGTPTLILHLRNEKNTTSDFIVKIGPSNHSLNSIEVHYNSGAKVLIHIEAHDEALVRVSMSRWLSYLHAVLTPPTIFPNLASSEPFVPSETSSPDSEHDEAHTKGQLRNLLPSFPHLIPSIVSDKKLRESLVALSSPNPPPVYTILKRGFLQKKGRINIAFKWRWFELGSDMKLRYYKSDYHPHGLDYQSHAKSFKGAVDLNNLSDPALQDQHTSVGSESQSGLTGELSLISGVTNISIFDNRITLVTNYMNNKTKKARKWILKSDDEKELEYWYTSLKKIVSNQHYFQENLKKEAQLKQSIDTRRPSILLYSVPDDEVISESDSDSEGEDEILSDKDESEENIQIVDISLD